MVFVQWEETFPVESEDLLCQCQDVESTQYLRVAHMGKVCVCVHRGVSICKHLCLYRVKKKEIEKHEDRCYYYKRRTNGRTQK